MKTLLLNGCSFGACWTPTDKFVNDLGCDETLNISKPATSFQRTCRSTIEWIAQNGNPHFVMVPITFSHRWELALSKDEDDIDGSWVPLQLSSYLSTEFNLQDSNIDDVKELVDQYYKVIPTIKTYWDKMFTEIIMLSAFLEKQKINYLMWDMCNDFDKEHLNIYRQPYKGFHKINLIAQNPRIIDIWKFCGNKYMWSNLQDNKNIDYNIHHAPEQYTHLEKYLLTCVKE